MKMQSHLFAHVLVSAALQGATWPVSVGYVQRVSMDKYMKRGTVMSQSLSPAGGAIGVLASTTTVAGIALASATGIDWRQAAMWMGEEKSPDEKYVGTVGGTSLLLSVLTLVILDTGENEKTERDSVKGTVGGGERKTNIKCR